MTISLVQSATGQGTAVFIRAPIPGNLLVLSMPVKEVKEAVRAMPAGWTLLEGKPGCAVFWRTADGSELTVTGSENRRLAIAEYAGVQGAEADEVAELAVFTARELREARRRQNRIERKLRG